MATQDDDVIRFSEKQKDLLHVLMRSNIRNKTNAKKFLNSLIVDGIIKDDLITHQEFTRNAVLMSCILMEMASQLPSKVEDSFYGKVGSISDFDLYFNGRTNEQLQILVKDLALNTSQYALLQENRDKLYLWMGRIRTNLIIDMDLVSAPTTNKPNTTKTKEDVDKEVEEKRKRAEKKALGKVVKLNEAGTITKDEMKSIKPMTAKTYKVFDDEAMCVDKDDDEDVAEDEEEAEGEEGIDNASVGVGKKRKSKLSKLIKKKYPFSVEYGIYFYFDTDENLYYAPDEANKMFFDWIVKQPASSSSTGSISK